MGHNKKEKMTRILIVLLVILTSCSTGHEAVMPFRNMSYSGERLFPIDKNNSEFTFRVWVNNGTSIDRVITVSRDSLFGEQCKLSKIGFLNKKGLFKIKTNRFFSESNLEPTSGFKGLILKIDSLNLLDYKSQESFDYQINHRPFSLYVVEIKSNGKYNQFCFRTHFPDTTKVSMEYEKIQALIFQEFKFYIKK
jgi:hypothetical protein